MPAPQQEPLIITDHANDTLLSPLWQHPSCRNGHTPHSRVKGRKEGQRGAKRTYSSAQLRAQCFVRISAIIMMISAMATRMITTAMTLCCIALAPVVSDQGGKLT